MFQATDPRILPECDHLTSEQEMRDLTKHPATEKLAIEAFEANERVRMLMIMNAPTDYEARKTAAVQLAVAQEAAMFAQRKLDARLRGE